MRPRPMSARARARAAPPRDEQDDPDDSGGLIVEHYRLDPSAALGRTLGWASLIVTAGSLVMAAAILVPRLDGREYASPVRSPARDGLFRAGEVTADGTPIDRPIGIELALVVLGLSCIGTGGVVAIVGLRRVLTEESYLALRTDGALFRCGAERALVRWDDVEAVRWDAAAGAVRFERHDGSAWLRAERYAGIDGAELAKRASEIRRKALFGLLPTSSRR